MKIAFHYGAIAPGGVERRLGDLYRGLMRLGDDVWIVALRFDPGGKAMLCKQGGVPESRILCAPPGTPFGGIGGEGILAQALRFLGLGHNETFSHWSRRTIANLEPDIIDTQWCALPIDYASPTVATIHGAIPLPRPGMFDGILFVSESMVMPIEGQAGPIRAIENWVDLDDHPFNEDLPEAGVCFLGRECKSENADAIAREWTGQIDCYADTWGQEHPPNMVYRGHGDPRKVFPQYRVCFTSGLAAMESIAAGRLTIMGRSNLYRRGDYRLVTPGRIAEMAKGRFADIGALEEVEPPTTGQRMQEFSKALGGGDYLKERRTMRAYLAEHHNATRQIRLVRNFYEEVLA